MLPKKFRGLCVPLRRASLTVAFVDRNIDYLQTGDATSVYQNLQILRHDPGKLFSYFYLLYTYDRCSENYLGSKSTTLRDRKQN